MLFLLWWSFRWFCDSRTVCYFILFWFFQGDRNLLCDDSSPVLGRCSSTQISWLLIEFGCRWFWLGSSRTWLILLLLPSLNYLFLLFSHEILWSGCIEAQSKLVILQSRCLLTWLISFLSRCINGCFITIRLRTVFIIFFVVVLTCLTSFILRSI